MNTEAVIGTMVHELLGVEVHASVPLAGGCIHDVRRIDLADGSRCVAKSCEAGRARLLHEEMRGLAKIAGSGGPRTPGVLGLVDGESCSVLLTEYLAPSTIDEVDWALFGEQLGAMHARAVEDRYGFDGDNHIGRTSQSNQWCDDWIEFLTVHRLGPQLAMATDRGHLDAAGAAAVQSVIDRLDRLVPRSPTPSLLHGDLWSGNALPLADGGVAVLDPACWYGDAWFDIGMMRLFGGFPDACFAAWEETLPDHEQAAERVGIAQLYHLLNHLNLFGAGYRGQVEAVVRALA